MKSILLSDFKISPIVDSAHQLNLTDTEYFSSKYKDYISNSRIKYINPDQEGKPSIYKNGIPTQITTSLNLGSAVHELFLQPDDFILGDDLNKPTSKLGQVVDTVITHRLKNKSILQSIHQACTDVSYYASTITDNKIKKIIEKGLHYYINSRKLDNNVIILPTKELETCKQCLKSLNNNNKIHHLIYPNDLLNDVRSFNEDALFMDINVVYKNQSVILKLKMKADNWTIDFTNKKVVLNDLKTSSKPIAFFMKEYGSFYHYHYSRQLAFYMWVLSQYCRKHYGFDDSWTIESNIIVVETLENYKSQVYTIDNDLILKGKKELAKLLKMVAYCELFGYDDELNFV